MLDTYQRRLETLAYSFDWDEEHEALNQLRHHNAYMFSLVGGILAEAFVFFFSSRRRHTRCYRDWSSDVCSSDLESGGQGVILTAGEHPAEPVHVPPARAASARPASTGAVLSASRTHAAAFFAGATAPHGRRTWRSALARGAQGRR